MTTKNVAQHVRMAAYWFGEMRRVQCAPPSDYNASRQGAYLGAYMKHALEVADAVEDAVITARAGGWAHALRVVRQKIDARIGT